VIQPHVRVKGDGFATKVELIDRDGNVTDLSGVVTRVEFTAHSPTGQHELPTAVIDVLCPRSDFVALMGKVEFNLREPGS